MVWDTLALVWTYVCNFWSNYLSWENSPNTMINYQLICPNKIKINKCDQLPLPLWVDWQTRNSKKGSKDLEVIQSSTKPDPRYHMGKWQKQLNITNKSQVACPPPPPPRRWTQGRNEQTRKHDNHKSYITQMFHEGTVKIFSQRAQTGPTETIQTLSSDVDKITQTPGPQERPTTHLRNIP